MPTGLVVMHWDERSGVKVIAAYPEEAEIQEKTLMQLYSQHEFTGEAGMVSISAGAVNLASYYTGPETAIYVILILTAEEDADAYEEGLAEIARQIVPNATSNQLSSLLPSLFQRLAVYPTLREEQRIALILNSDVNRMIINRLREEAAIMKSEISVWLKDEYKDGFIDIESVLNTLIKAGIIKVSSVKGLPSDMIFLAQDIVGLRLPPQNLIYDPVERHLPASLKESYLNEVQNFFANYQPTEQDNLDIIDKVMLDPGCYETLQLLREAIVTRNDLEKLRKKGVDDVDRVLKAFWETNMVSVFQDDKHNEYYCLTTDFQIEKMFPRYVLDMIRYQYRTKAQNPKALLKALDILEEEFYTDVKAKEARIEEVSGE